MLEDIQLPYWQLFLWCNKENLSLPIIIFDDKYLIISYIV